MDKYFILFLALMCALVILNGVNDSQKLGEGNKTLPNLNNSSSNFTAGHFNSSRFKTMEDMMREKNITMTLSPDFNLSIYRNKKLICYIPRESNGTNTFN
jgi:hypothetical protein